MTDCEKIYKFVQDNKLGFEGLLIAVGFIIGVVLCYAIGPIFEVGSEGFFWNTLLFIIGYILLGFWYTHLIGYILDFRVLESVSNIWSIIVLIFSNATVGFSLIILPATYGWWGMWEAFESLMSLELLGLLLFGASILFYTILCAEYGSEKDSKKENSLITALIIIGIFYGPTFVTVYLLLLFLSAYPIFLLTIIPLSTYAISYPLRIHILRKVEKMVQKKKILLTKVEEIEKLISKNLPASKPDEAKILKNDALQKIEQGLLEEAEKLLKQAEILAKPTPDYVLQNAKRLAEEAKQSFESKDYEQAINLWKESVEEYERAKTLSLERNDTDIAKAIDETIEILRQNLEKAQIAFDRERMVGAIEEGKNFVRKGNELLEKSQFDQAKKDYEKGLEKYEFALEIAEKRGFEETEKLRKAIESVKESIESCLIGKAEQMIEEAGKIDDPIQSERKFREILSWLENQNINERDLNRLKAWASEGLVGARLKQAENEMKEAERLFDEKRYYDAKEKYKSIWSYLNEVLDEATNLGATLKIDYINRLIDACNRNITKATTLMFKVGEIKVGEIERIDEIVEGNVAIKTENEELTPIEKAKMELKRTYREIKFIGSGGFADVFRVMDKNCNIYAVKVPRLLDEKDEEIFLNEVTKWRELNHRNIVKLIRARINPPHLVLEYVKGKSLEKLLKEKGKLDVLEACKIAFDVARALEYAHSKHILHCDLKPSNILIDECLGEAKVTDFGLAKDLSSSGVKGGTLDYLPPEAPNNHIEKSDIYQLGLIFYEMIAGKLPDKNNPKPLGFEKLDYLIARCLSEDPKERPSAREFREVIYEFVKEQYGVSLKLSKEPDTLARCLLELALYDVKSNELTTALARLEEAKKKVTRSDVRSLIEKAIEEVKFWLNANAKPSEELIDKLRYLLKVVS